MAEGAERPAVEAFEERCVEATVRLTHAMSPTVVLLVQALDCPVEIWKRLEGQYEKRTAASKLSLVQKYFGAKMAEGESAEKHLLNMSELWDRLAAMELPVPEEFQPLMILASLPSSYTAIVQTLGSQAGKLDLSHVTSTIMDEEARRSHATDTQALISHGGQPNRNSARRVQCYNCEKLGHFSRDCTEKPDLSNLKVFGCVAYALVPAAKRRKFGDRTEKMRFLGYHKGHRGYRLVHRSSRKLEKVHSDVCGPMQTLSNSGKRYMVTFVDDFTRSCAVYFMAHKSDTLEMFKEFHAKVTGESGERIGILKTDGGGEYKSREFAQYLINHQIEHEVMVPDSLEMNGLAERMNRTILEKAKCMCVHAGLPYSLWAEAANTATYVYNRVPNAPLKGKSPHEMWYGRKPDLSNLKVFGCVAYALVPAAKRRKFGGRTEKMRFLGYHKGHRGYRLMERGGNRVFYRTDVTFDEHNFRLTPEEDERRVMETPSGEINVCSSGRRAGKPAPEVPVAVPDRVPANLRVMPEMVAVRNEPQPELAAVHSRPTRMKKPINRYGVDEQAKVAEVDDEVEEVIASALCAAEMDEPKTLQEARKRPDASKWLAAAQEEMDSLIL